VSTELTTMGVKKTLTEAVERAKILMTCTVEQYTLADPTAAYPKST